MANAQINNMDCQVPGPASMATLLSTLEQSKLWEIARMSEVVDYLSKNKSLTVPPAFESAILKL